MKEIEKKLDDLYAELDSVQHMSEEAVCLTYNVDRKQEYIQLIIEEIDSLEDQLEELEAYEDRETNYRRTADMPCLCW
ncbi:hypothetical protein AAE250_20570 [Bacteroides sp. GD17]|jgi:CCR4-NOT transcriptional regulation complex NOT5 subunit|uniref:hypothetical protein n=1 Tax=Bacteroides sp. GD17 TaxID=3139826 RepID=UPI0025D2B4F1|nr:hypothetical protein [uncultured Bacteroides sp.]